MSRRLRVLVIAGGPSSEHEVSLWSAAMILKNLDQKKYDSHLVVIEKSGKWKFENRKAIDIGDAINYIRKSSFGFAFIALHGAFGEDGRIQGLLEWIGLPYNGSGVEASALAMDKNLSNTIYRTNGLAVPPYIVLEKISSRNISRFPLPFVVKPLDGGSTVGVSIVKKRTEIKKALAVAFGESDRIIVQKYIKGREFTCGVLEDKTGKPFAVVPTEIIPKASSFFDYRAKYTKGGSVEITPPRLPKAKIKELQKMAVTAHSVLGCRGYSRSDFMMQGSKFYILETNTLPGMTVTSLLPQGAKAADIGFSEMLDMMIAHARNFAAK